MPTSIDRRLEQIQRRLERERERAAKIASAKKLARWQAQVARRQQRAEQEKLRQLRWRMRYRKKFGVEPPGQSKKILEILIIHK